MKKKYDICIISFSDLRFDARTLNLYNMCKKMNLKVLIIYASYDQKYILKHSDEDNHIYFMKENKRMIYNWFFFIKYIKKIIKHLSFKTLWAAGLYSLVSLKFIKNKSNKNIIYDSREIYSALSTLSNYQIKQTIITRIERKYIKFVLQLVVSGELDADYMRKFYKLNIPIHIIYNYPLYKEKINSSLIRDKFNIPTDKIILVYQGVILKGRGILPVIKAIASNTKYVLVVLGDGNYKKELINYCNENQLNGKVYFCGNIPYQDLHDWTCSGDIGLCNIEPISQSYYFALPNKLFEYFQAGLPVLVTDLPALSKLVKLHNVGEIISKDNNADEIISALTQLTDNYQYYKKNIDKISNCYHYESQFNLIKDIINIS